MAERIETLSALAQQYLEEADNLLDLVYSAHRRLDAAIRSNNPKELSRQQELIYLHKQQYYRTLQLAGHLMRYDKPQQPDCLPAA
ncbi:MAG: hypothetical protein LBR73_02500 [Oscillospiraceae bacterium]|nr:hypothetical protein [Oscillospiraceae bacterium]